jgi:hypothetical protein
MAKAANRKKASNVAPVEPLAQAPACLGVDDLNPPMRERLFGGDAKKEMTASLELFSCVDGEQPEEEKMVRDLIFFYRRAESQTERDKAYYSMLEFLRNSRNQVMMGPRKPRRLRAALCALIVDELQRDVVRMLRYAEL